jgi:hypothetical protein
MIMLFSAHTRRIVAYPGVLVLVAECGVFQRRSAQGGRWRPGQGDPMPGRRSTRRRARGGEGDG